jgi:hypothetical protein
MRCLIVTQDRAATEFFFGIAAVGVAMLIQAHTATMEFTAAALIGLGMGRGGGCDAVF